MAKWEGLAQWYSLAATTKEWSTQKNDDNSFFSCSNLSIFCVQIWDFWLSRDDMRVIDDMNVGWRILLWPEVALHPDYPFKDELPYNFRQEDDNYSRWFFYLVTVQNLSSSA